ncbi:MAG: ATP-dependent DNA helicase RecG [Lachnospiraceae bacterium]|nr:ATP-dependent DNA helicase RecG [Lachnospiraceae bacterium]
MSLNENISSVKGIGEKTEKLFNKLDIYTKSDLLKYFPKGYERFDEVKHIDEVTEGQVCAIYALLKGGVAVRSGRRLKITACEVTDGTGVMSLTWFNMPFLRSSLKQGVHYVFRGNVIKKNGSLKMEQPKIMSIEEYTLKQKVLQPIYPLTKGITSLMISKAEKNAIKELYAGLDYLEPKFRKEKDLMALKEAIEEIHFPKSDDIMLDARKRLVFDEFFLFLLAAKAEKSDMAEKKSIYKIDSDIKTKKLIAGLPYKLTGAQERTFSEMEFDMKEGFIMNRLIQGDVGSGKTILAALALCLVAENGYQGALMAPTEVLARQHFEELTGLFKPLGINVTLIVGSMSAKEKKAAYELISSHETDIIIGTHALIQEKVVYDKLALVITDEQHRFGVKQREKLMAKGDKPHVCVMSATPIPRTLAVILYGDLDISIVDELPKGRKAIKNCVVGNSYREKAYSFINKEIMAGHQVYIICPMVSESEKTDAENVEDYTESLKEVFDPRVRIASLYGKMSADEKNRVMEDFSNGKIDILVSTTVVEVGVNVPNATVMLIENAERFGLAQLHQLRGRVGRGDAQSYCIFMAGNTSSEVMERLNILNNSNDGFKIAEEDLRLRGPGDLFGIRQSGDLSFNIGDIYNDASVLKEASDAASCISTNDAKTILEKAEVFYSNAFCFGKEGNVL